MFRWSFTLVRSRAGLSDRSPQLAADVKELYLAGTTEVEVCIAQRWLGTGMPQDVADVRILADHIFKIILEVQIRVRGIEATEQDPPPTCSRGLLRLSDLVLA